MHRYVCLISTQQLPPWPYLLSSRIDLLLYSITGLDRFRSDHATRPVPLQDVNETKVAILEDGTGLEAELESFYKNLFLIQDLYTSGYRMADVGPDENGLVR